MATTRNQVLSLFGASPEQILEQKRREAAMDVLKQQDPFQRAGAAVGLGLARLFGGEPAEVTRQRELYGMLEGVNFDSPEQMRAAASSLSSQFPDRALQLLSMADQLETSQQSRATSAAQEAKAGFINVPKFVGFVSVPKSDGMGGFVTSTQPKYENTPIPVKEYEQWQKGEGQYKDWYPSAEAGAETPQPQLGATGEKGTLVGTRYVDGQPIYVYSKDGETTAYTADGKPYVATTQQTPTTQPPLLPAIQEQRTRIQNQNVKPLPGTGVNPEDQTNPFAM